MRPLLRPGVWSVFLACARTRPPAAESRSHRGSGAGRAGRGALSSGGDKAEPAPSPGAKMWIQVRTIDGSQTRTIEDVSRKATIEELRERVWALFDVRPECQRLFYRGKQVRRAHRIPREARGEGSGAPPGRVGWAGPKAWCAARAERTWFPVGCAAREPQGGPGPAEGTHRGPPPASSAGAPGEAVGRVTSFSAGQQSQAQPARAPGLPCFPRSMGSGGRGGQRAVEAMAQCGQGGPAAPAPGGASPANSSPRFRAFPLPKRRGGNLRIAGSRHKNPNSVSSLWKGYVDTEDSQSFQNLGLPSLISSSRIGICLGGD